MTSPPKLTNSSAQKLINSQNHQHTKSSAHELISSQTHQFKNSLTHKLINSQTHQLTNSSVQKLINSLTQKLKSLSFILRYCSNFCSVLAKIQAEKLVKSRFFYPFASLALSIFTPRTCILHHFAFLVWLRAGDFSSPFFCF